MTLIFVLDLDMVKMYHHTKNEVSVSTASKVIAWTDRHRHTDTHTDVCTHTHTHRCTHIYTQTLLKHYLYRIRASKILPAFLLPKTEKAWCGLSWSLLWYVFSWCRFAVALPFLVGVLAELTHKAANASKRNTTTLAIVIV